MASTSDLLVDGFSRVHETVHRVVKGLTLEAITFRPDEAANPIGWLVWHLTRVQDDHVAEVAGVEQRWSEEGWDARFALPFEQPATGYGQSAADAGAVAVGAPLLLGYHDAVHEATLAYVRGLADADLERIVDTRWHPHVTLGVRLVSVLSDDLQHVGQAAYVRGIYERRAG